MRVGDVLAILTRNIERGRARIHRMAQASQFRFLPNEVDREITEKPEHWDMRFIRNFMLLLGPVSSVFDF